MPFPELLVDRGKIKCNTEAAVSAAAGIDVFGVTKGCGGSPVIAKAMLDGGAAGLADSRISHLSALRKAFPSIPLLALRQPSRHEIGDLVRLKAAAFVGDYDTGLALSQAATAADCVQIVLVPIEVGEGREGVPAGEALDFIDRLNRLPALQVDGIAAIVGCRDGIVPTSDILAVLDDIVAGARARGGALNVVSAGNSSCWSLLVEGTLPITTSQMRFGELILLGVETSTGRPVRGFFADAITVRAEVLEAREKQDGLQAVLALGCRDIGIGTLYPLDPKASIIKMTSDHTVVKLPPGAEPAAGDIFEFQPSYFALQTLFDSADVTPVYIGYNNQG